MVCEPMLDYGATAAQWTEVEDEHGKALDATDGVTAFRLFSDTRMGIEGNRVHSRHTLTEGEKRFCALSWTKELRGPRNLEQAEARIERTNHFWRTWLAEGSYPDHRWRAHLQRSALTLKGLTFMPTGALVAAPTTSLPETPRGSRNWDYRYCWMRDASFTLWVLHALGLDWEADDFIQYVADMERNEDGSLQIMYGIKGQKDLASRRSSISRAMRARVRCGSATARMTSARTTCTARCSTRCICTPSSVTTSLSGCGRC